LLTGFSSFSLALRLPQRSTLFPYTTLFRSRPEQGSHGAVDVAHRKLQSHRPCVLQRRLGELDERTVERSVETVVLLAHLSTRSAPRGHREDRRQVEPLRLPVLHRLVDVEQIGPADGLVE